MEYIQVALRVRPLNLKESLIQDRSYLLIKDDNISIHPKSLPETSPNLKKPPLKQTHSFTYDHCFSEGTSNQLIYEKTVRNLVSSSLMGINATVFMYGQTGAGKTYTMLGQRKGNLEQEGSQSKTSISEELKDNSGVLIFALNEFFEMIQNENEKSFIVRCSYIEIYNENTYDLLSDENSEVLSIVEDVSKKEFFVKGANEILVSSKKEILEILKKGEANRHYALTNLNHSSSRSHTIFSLKVKSISNIARSFIESQLNFVDLAGSEKLSNYQLTEEEMIERDYLSDNCNNMGSGEQGTGSTTNFAQRLREGQSINKSLFFLTHVISLRSEGKNTAHIPYRNSPLTKILRSSLGGNSRTLIILCITPALTQLDQSISTMRFGAQAKKIENKVQANIITAANENETIRLLIDDYEKKLKQLERERAEDKERIKLLTSELNGKMRNPPDYKSYQKRNCNECEYFQKIGLVFLPKNSLNKTRDIREYCDKNLRKDWQGLIFDAEGKIALEAYKKIKKLQNVFLQNQQQHERNFKDIKNTYMDLNEKYLNLEQKKSDYKSKAKKLLLKLNLTQKELIFLRNRLKLIESFQGINNLKNQEILALEEMYSKGLVQCQNERLNRINKKTSNFTHVEDEESPRKDNRPLNQEYCEFSDDEEKISSKDSFEEIEEKIKKQENSRSIKLENENNLLEEKFMKNIKKINLTISFRTEELKNFEQNYLDLILKKTNEERINFISSSLTNKNKEKTRENKQKPSKLSTKKMEMSSDSSPRNDFPENGNKKSNQPRKPSKNFENNPETSIKLSTATQKPQIFKNDIEKSSNEEISKPTATLKIPEHRKQRFRSLDEREIEDSDKIKKETPKKTPKMVSKTKDFVEINKKHLGFKNSLSKPLFDTQRKTDSATSTSNNATANNTNNQNNNNNNQFLDNKMQKAMDRGNLFLVTTDRNEKMEIKSAQMPPKTPVFDSNRKKTQDQETLSTEDEKKKLLNNPKNTLMTLLSNLNNVNNNQNTGKKGEVPKEGQFFPKGNITESCAFKISNYKSILDKETMKLIEEKRRKIMGNIDKGSEPNESGIEKIVENDSFFSNCVNGFEYLLDGGAEKNNAKGLDDIFFESDSGIGKIMRNNAEKSSGFKKKKTNK